MQHAIAVPLNEPSNLFGKGHAFFNPTAAAKGKAILPFVIPSEAEGSAVTLPAATNLLRAHFKTRSVSGHDFSRAVEAADDEGFSPCGAMSLSVRLHEALAVP